PSAAWTRPAILVWWLGEGPCGVLAGAVSPAMGLPGAVIVYALIAVLLWPPRADATPAPGALSVAESGPVGVAGARAVWVLFWGAFVFETLRPADRSARALGSMVSGMADGEPHWLATVDRWASHAVVGDGTQTSIVLAVVFAALALCVLVPVDRRPVLAIGVIVSALVWLIAEDLGQIATGNATDCNSGPLLALLATCYWPVASRRRSPDRTVVRDAPAARIAPA
ncbi:MAG: hypothetical protein J0H43_03540, partial [Actinobacteria bacterium]|nr:hypothetical protein [Actinomycetota bacterium]